MKRASAIPRKFKDCFSAYCLNPNHWLLVDEWDFYIKVVNKNNPKCIRYLDKFRGEMKKIEESIQTHSKGKQRNRRNSSEIRNLD